MNTHIIKEQFKIANMDFNNIQKKHNFNIFNKNAIDPYKIYNKLLENTITDEEFHQLSELVSAVKPKKKIELKTIIKLYSDNYPDKSLNWLDVSEILSMPYLFSNTVYNGDISQWDVSNVKKMRGTFSDSKFDGDISGWDVSNVDDMAEMFKNSPFNGDISGWDVSNVVNFKDIFKNCNIKKEYTPIITARMKNW